MRDFTMRPKGGERANSVASTLQIIAVIIWIGGFFLGIYMGATTGKFSSYFGGSEFSWKAAFITWIASFLSGLFPWSFAEIICLLQKGNTLSYDADNFRGLDDNDEPRSEPVSEKEERKTTSFTLITDGQDLPFSLEKIGFIQENRDTVSVALSVQWPGVVMINGILADVEITTLFGDTTVIEDVPFMRLSGRGKKSLISDGSKVGLSENMLGMAERVRVIVKKYVFNDEIHFPGDVITIPEMNGKSTMGRGFGTDMNTFLNNISMMSSSAEIKEYVNTLDRVGDPIITAEIRDAVDYSVMIEKSYGNNYSSCVKKLREIFGLDYVPENREDDIPTVQHISRNTGSLQSAPMFTEKIPMQNTGQIPMQQTGQIPMQQTGRMPMQQTGQIPLQHTGQISYQQTGQIPIQQTGQIPVQQTGYEVLYCASCGKRIEEPDAIFCPSCGSMIER